jgi:hypothetical protein
LDGRREIESGLRDRRWLPPPPVTDAGRQFKDELDRELGGLASSYVASGAAPWYRDRHNPDRSGCRRHPDAGRDWLQEQQRSGTIGRSS